MTSQKMYSLEELKELVKEFLDSKESDNMTPEFYVAPEYFLQWLKKKNPVEQQMKYKHLSPRYYDYKGEYNNLVHCTGCQTLGLYSDLHPAHPCPNCGESLIVDGIVGRYDFKTKEWILK